LQKIYKFSIFRINIEKEEVGILIAFILGFFVISFYGKFTGNIVNEGILECNIADFNADGKVDYVDKVDFAREYDLNYGIEKYCGPLDVIDNRVINIFDSNEYAKLYSQNYGAYTGECQRKLVCEEIELELEPESGIESDLIAERQTKLAEEKPSFFKGIKDFFKGLFYNKGFYLTD